LEYGAQQQSVTWTYLVFDWFLVVGLAFTLGKLLIGYSKLLLSRYSLFRTCISQVLSIIQHLSPGASISHISRQTFCASVAIVVHLITPSKGKVYVKLKEWNSHDSIDQPPTFHLSQVNCQSYKIIYEHNRIPPTMHRVLNVSGRPVPPTGYGGKLLSRSISVLYFSIQAQKSNQSYIRKRIKYIKRELRARSFAHRLSTFRRSVLVCCV